MAAVDQGLKIERGIGFVGPNLHLAPDADVADGRLDVVAVTEDERTVLSAHLEALLRGDASPLDFASRQGRHVQVEWDGRPLHIDSHVWADDRCTLPKCRTPDAPARGTVDVRVEAGALTFLVNDA